MVYETSNIKKVCEVYSTQNNTLRQRTSADTDESEFAKRLEKARKFMKQQFVVGGKGRFIDELV